ncbi:HsdM family class I SAM-dependent methyltransferase [Turicibacter bilis]|uniref:site-specific DNA-methyltransferase (adenine-specific) n=1 Tax=Turicibacter bilis TaxID=2735723 RepID=A0ABY5JKF9_9FIRM|nr:class I SAM-dependent DNA methyltransferase [Turicibacter bilis]MBS3199856.1 SAM-dependent DNA methyltransferase [Turicibacter bilis]UUF06723.1 SAM-dependent DNA methyltransferase [Turicibacter bilis]
MTIESMIKRIQDITRQDAGINGDAQRIEQLVWMLFLKIYDAKEEFWEFEEDDYESIIPEEFKWRNWAVDHKDGKALTGEELLHFINNKLFPTLKNLEVNENTARRAAVVKDIFQDANNFMKNGVLLRQIINILNEVDFTEYDDRHSFNDVYELILKDLQSAGNSGEFYSPRPCTDFIVEMLEPKIGEKVADFACGTGGFLISAINHMREHVKSTEDMDKLQNGLYGIEKKPLPYLLATTNMILHDIDTPRIDHDNSLGKSVRDYKESDRFDVIIMNPPYGGVEESSIQNNFPVELRTSETADLFMALIIYRLKQNGRCGVILPDGFLFGTDNAKVAIKKKLLEECNLHTIIRLPGGVFAPYTSISTNILFFDKSGPTQETWYYEHQVGYGTKTYSKTKPIRHNDFKNEREWWNNREENEVAWKVSMDEIIANNFNLDFKNPSKAQEEALLSSEEYVERLKEAIKESNDLVQKLEAALKA